MYQKWNSCIVSKSACIALHNVVSVTLLALGARVEGVSQTYWRYIVQRASLQWGCQILVHWSLCPHAAFAAVYSVLPVSHCLPLCATVFITFSVLMSGSTHTRPLSYVQVQVYLPCLSVQVDCSQGRIRVSIQIALYSFKDHYNPNSICLL